MMKFAKLKALRAHLAAASAFQIDAETRKALVDAIGELDDAMVEDERAWEADRARAYIATLPPVTDYTSEMLARFAGSATTAEYVS